MNVRDRGIDLDKDTRMDVDNDSANGDSVIQWVLPSSINSNPSPAAPSQTHSGPGCDSTPGHTLVTAIQASSQLLQNLPLGRVTQIIFTPGQIVQDSGSMPSNLTKAICMPTYSKTHAQQLPEM